MADEFLRVGGRGEDGLAKALQTDNNGNLKTSLTGEAVAAMQKSIDQLNHLMGIDMGMLTPYYTNAYEHVKWVDGYTSELSHTREKRDDHMYLLVDNNPTTSGEIAYVTDVALDLTNIKFLFIDWENSGSATNNIISSLCISKNKGGSSFAYDKRINRVNRFSRQVLSVNVEDLSGTYFMRLHSRDGQTTVSSKSELKVYRIWGV